MFNPVRTKAARVAAVLTIGSAGLGLAGIVGSASAHADPTFSTALQGVGSDTIQDLFDAYAGQEPFSPSASAISYAPLEAGTSDGADNAALSSWDAVPYNGSASAPGGIYTRLGGPEFDRPNGSSNGILALRAAFGIGSNANGASDWEASTASFTNAPINISGQVDFARSSRGPSSSGSTLTFIPFARDGVTYAYVQRGSANLSQLTSATLTSLYNGGTTTVGSDKVAACLPQPGSGTRSFWESAINVTDTQAGNVATANGCNTSEENGGNSFLTFANSLPAGEDAIIPFSVGSYIAQNNGVAQDRSAIGRAGGVKLGDPDGLGGGSPYSGSGTSLTANPTFYQSSTYGRDLFVVVATSEVSGLNSNSNVESFFVGNNSASSFGSSPSVGTGAVICSAGAQATAQKFGFASLTTSDLTSPVGGNPTALPCGDATDDQGSN